MHTRPRRLAWADGCEPAIVQTSLRAGRGRHAGANCQGSIFKDVLIDVAHSLLFSRSRRFCRVTTVNVDVSGLGPEDNQSERLTQAWSNWLGRHALSSGTHQQSLAEGTMFRRHSRKRSPVRSKPPIAPIPNTTRMTKAVSCFTGHKRKVGSLERRLKLLSDGNLGLLEVSFNLGGHIAAAACVRARAGFFYTRNMSRVTKLLATAIVVAALLVPEIPRPMHTTL